MILNYRHKSGGSDWQPMDYPVRLDWTGCTLGGRRAWLLCPALGCGRRVALVYRWLVSSRVGTATGWPMPVQRETGEDRAMRRADNIRRRLGWKPGIANPEGAKPKGMHWRTFERMKAEHDAFANASMAGMMWKFGRLGVGFDDLLDV